MASGSCEGSSFGAEEVPVSDPESIRTVPLYSYEDDSSTPIGMVIQGGAENGSNPDQSGSTGEGRLYPDMVQGKWRVKSMWRVIGVSSLFVAVFFLLYTISRKTVVTTIRSDLRSKLCADLSASKNQTDQLIQWSCHDGRNQNFIFEPVPMSTRYRIKVHQTGRCLQINGRSEYEGAWVVQGECNDERHQLWTVSGKVGYQQFRVAHTGMCLSIPDDSMDKGVNLVQWPCFCGDPWTGYFWRADDRLWSPMAKCDVGQRMNDKRSISGGH